MKTKTYDQLVKNWVGPDPKYDYLFDMPLGKFNDHVTLNGSDKGSVRILCKEPYAQEVYEKMCNHGESVIKSKDLVKNTVYEVVAKSLCKTDKLVKCVDANGSAEIYVPLSEIKGDVREKVNNGESFEVMVTKTEDGFNFASRRKCEKIINANLLSKYMRNNTDFDVTITQLIRGGFIALFNGSIECFLPGAHAAANIIYDFESYLGKTVRVCVDNYDNSSEMYIVSHKKYIKKVLPERVQDIEYGKKYTGTLTSNPTKFGIFVEFAIKPEYGSIFTGLIKAGTIPADLKLKQGDQIDFYVSNVISNERGVKINLVYNIDEIPEDNILWQKRKLEMEGKTWNYVYMDGTLTVLDENQEAMISMGLDGNAYKNELNNFKKVLITNVDIINKQLGLEFAS